nr:hypothetical protein BaRGS_023526 [Batillaria attramentaria]
MEVVYTFKGQEKRIVSTSNLADGQWHSSQVVKDKTKLRLEVDGQLIDSDKIEARLDIDLPLYIGSLPKKEDIKIDVYLDAAGVLTVSCEWVISMTFEVGQSLTVELEFRTSERDGVFLTISSADGETGMTLELHEGKVKFAVKNREGTFRAESDNIDTNAYCGGFDNQVASLSRRGFYGCMKNLVIDGYRVDWYALVDTSDVKRTACPFSIVKPTVFFLCESI